MELELIKQRLIDAIEQTKQKDMYLLEHDINERTIAHRLAMYLTPMFPDFDVDCEYNGDIGGLNDRKYILLLKERAKQLRLLREDERELDQELVYRCIYPDIIVHKRGANDHNLLIIEVKKSSNNHGIDWDDEKLKRFTSPQYDNHFNYDLGSFICFDVKDGAGEYSIKWYQNGQLLQHS